MPGTDERTFQNTIIAYLTDHGWVEGSPGDYDKPMALDTAQLFTFIGATQQLVWDKLVLAYGGAEAAQRGFTERLARQLTKNGTLQVLRNGLKDRGVTINLAYFKPGYVPSAEVLKDYRQNILSVTQELRYATDNANRLDLALFLNGIPVATAELKNPLNGQDVHHAIGQYRKDRNPKETIFKDRAMAHFAADPDLVYLTTHLEGEATRFLPFNQGSNGPGQRGGAGNPPARPRKHRTAYLWEQVWQRDNWIEILERFVTGGGKSKTIFPRYHQWDAVQKILAHVRQFGAGHNYLAMHSAGSGKSNTIAWLVHALASLYSTAEADTAGAIRRNEPIFDKVLVITDRNVLDKQLQATVKSFERTAGLVRRIDAGSAKSGQLADALASSTDRIIVVTLQTFPSLLKLLADQPRQISGQRFAVVVDEAHSSQSGEAATAVKQALRDLGLDLDDEPGASELDAAARKSAISRNRAKNLSYFAFTATPKAKSLELFGSFVDGVYAPFHAYSMRQAIKEGFILDPLKNYLMYSTYYRLVAGDDLDREVPARKGMAKLARFASLHHATLAQHAEIIVEHFRAHTESRLGGRAKAMVVCRSREAALKLYRAIVRYADDTEYPLGVLVAFSGSLQEGDEEVTEASINGFGEAELPKRFHKTKADNPHDEEFRLLVVADKYQTGFDQPLLTTMYVEKPLAGIAAVQTLSRLNRTNSHKSQDDLAVLDFVNAAEDIQTSFLPFFEEARATPTDPNLLYDAQDVVIHAGLIRDDEIDALFAAYQDAEAANPGGRRWHDLHAEVYRHTDPARDRFRALLDGDEDDEAAAELFRVSLADYVNKYGFLSQIVPYTDPDLEKLYVYGKHLLARLPARDGTQVDVGNVELTHLKVVKKATVDVSLTAVDPTITTAYYDGSSLHNEDDVQQIAVLIEQYNEKNGSDLSMENLLGHPVVQGHLSNTDTELLALNNAETDFVDEMSPALKREMVAYIHEHDQRHSRFVNDDQFRDDVSILRARAIYQILHNRPRTNA